MSIRSGPNRALPSARRRQLLTSTARRIRKPVSPSSGMQLTVSTTAHGHQIAKRAVIHTASFARTLSAICPCPRAPGRPAARIATDSVSATCLTCADETTPLDAASYRAQIALFWRGLFGSGARDPRGRAARRLANEEDDSVAAFALDEFRADLRSHMIERCHRDEISRAQLNQFLHRFGLPPLGRAGPPYRGRSAEGLSHVVSGGMGCSPAWAVAGADRPSGR